jgi:methyl-accepting chemotaxis protein
VRGYLVTREQYFVDELMSARREAQLLTERMQGQLGELSTKQQSTAVEQVNVAIASVAQAFKETEASASQTLQTASQLTSLSRDLMRILQPEAA